MNLSCCLRHRLKDPYWVPVQVLAAPFSIQPPANVLGKAVEAVPSAWAPATSIGDLVGFPGSSLHPGPSFSCCGYMGNEPVDVFLSLCIFAFQMKISLLLFL